jgi:hypothetical protein
MAVAPAAPLASPQKARSRLARGSLAVAGVGGVLLVLSLGLGGMSHGKSWDLHWFGALGFYAGPAATLVALVAAIRGKDRPALFGALAMFLVVGAAIGFALLIAVGSASAY